MGQCAQRMIAACKDWGIASPVWEEIDSRLRVTIYAEHGGKVTADSTDKAIIELLENGDGLGTSQIAESIGLSSRAIRTRLAKLVARGLVREIGTGPKDPKRRYFKVGTS
jgi:DNA-binding transcriptional ArsR family regulator